MSLPRRPMLAHAIVAVGSATGVLGVAAHATGAQEVEHRPGAGSATAAPARSKGPVITAAGDIARRHRPGSAQTATAALTRRLDPTAVLTLGDNQYPSGSLSDFRSSYAPTWGRFRSKTYPAPGNHDHETPGARGYFAYFGKRAHGPPAWYAYRLGAWRMIALDSVFGDDPPASELRWLRHELRSHHRACQLAYFHHPRFSSGSEHGSNPHMAPFWTLLQRYGVDVVLNGHDHDYERFARLLPNGRPSAHGIREFVVGTGGAPLRPFGHHVVRGSQVRRVVNGVLRMQLRHGAYGWRFIRTGGAVVDRGTTPCH